MRGIATFPVELEISTLLVRPVLSLCFLSIDVRLIGQMENIKVYASRDIPQFESLMIDKHDALTRFIHIIQPLAQVYKLAPTSIHIFYGLGSDIAFNRNASLFLNLRDYEDKRKFICVVLLLTAI